MSLIASVGANYRPGRVLDEDGAIREAIETGHTLPSSWYTDEQIFRLEQQLIFRRQWEFVGHLGQVAKPGDFFAYEASGVPIVVVRDHDSTVRAFVNICRHRHNPVAVGAGNSRVLMCRYHAWTYKLDGKLNKAPRSKEDPDFDGTQLSLTALPIDFLGEMIFVNPSGDAPPLSDVLGPIPELARQKGIPLDRARFRECRTMEFEANWKLPWDNNVECYHCPTVHRTWYRQARLDPEHVYSFPIGPFHFQHVVDQRENAITDNHFYCWPAFCLTTDSSTGADFDRRTGDLHPVNDGADPSAATAALPGYFMWKFVPLSASRTRMEWHMFTVDAADPQALNEIFEGLLSVVREDQEICEGVQRSHESGAGQLGTLIPAIDSEFTTLVWEKLVHRALTQPEVPLYAPLLEPSATWPDRP